MVRKILEHLDLSQIHRGHERGTAPPPGGFRHGKHRQSVRSNPRRGRSSGVPASDQELDGAFCLFPHELHNLGLVHDGVVSGSRLVILFSIKAHEEISRQFVI